MEVETGDDNGMDVIEVLKVMKRKRCLLDDNATAVQAEPVQRHHDTKKRLRFDATQLIYRLLTDMPRNLFNSSREFWDWLTLITNKRPDQSKRLLVYD